MKKIIAWVISCMLILSIVFTGNVYVKAATTPELNKSNITLVKGNTELIKIQDASDREKNAAEWESSNPKVVTVTQTGQTGRLKAKEIGEAKIIVSVAGRKLICKVTVESLTTNYTEKVVSLINEKRVQNGLEKLKQDEKLMKAAQVRAKEFAENPDLKNHERPNGKDYKTVLSEYSIKYCGINENLIKEEKTPASVMATCLDDPGKRANILTSGYTHIGVGYYNGYWVQLFIQK